MSRESALVEELGRGSPIAWSTPTGQRKPQRLCLAILYQTGTIDEKKNQPQDKN